MQSNVCRGNHSSVFRKMRGKEQSYRTRGELKVMLQLHGEIYFRGGSHWGGRTNPWGLLPKTCSNEGLPELGLYWRMKLGKTPRRAVPAALPGCCAHLNLFPPEVPVRAPGSFSSAPCCGLSGQSLPEQHPDGWKANVLPAPPHIGSQQGARAELTLW